MHLDLHHHASNLTYLRHARKISDCALASVGHSQGLHLHTRIDSIRLQLRPFAYDSAYPSELPSEPSKLPSELSKLSSEPSELSSEPSKSHPSTQTS